MRKKNSTYLNQVDVRKLSSVLLPKKRRASTLQHGSELDILKQWFKRNISNGVSWLKSSFVKGDDQFF
jgi:hypothetical protein